MFLIELNKAERKIFLELAQHAMASSGEIKAEEEEIFNSYAYECEMADYEVQKVELPALITASKTYTLKKRRIMLIELWGIILADDEVSDKESEWMETLAQRMEFSSAQSRRIRRWAKDFVDIIGDAYQLIEGK